MVPKCIRSLVFLLFLSSFILLFYSFSISFSYAGQLDYSTFIGGNGDDQLAVGGIVLDASGNIYITGRTNSTNFPTTAGCLKASKPTTDYDIFVCKLNLTGTALIYSTYIGGTTDDYSQAIAVDVYGNTYITGDPPSADYPITSGSFDVTYSSGKAYVTKLNALGNSLVYSTFLGGIIKVGTFVPDNIGTDIKVDLNGNVYVVGQTGCSDFPVTAGTVQTTYRGSGCNSFITKLDADGQHLIFSTLLGGSYADTITSLALDINGNIYVTGGTGSADFPTTPGAFDTTNHDNSDIFVSKINPTATSLIYSTYLGGANQDSGQDIKVDKNGNAFITGWTQSTAFPTTSGSFDTTYNGVRDTYITKFNSTGTGLIYSTYFGGMEDDYARSIAIDANGNAYITGYTTSSSDFFPITPGAYNESYSGDQDVFVTKLDSLGSQILYSTYIGSSNSETGYAITIDAHLNAYIAGVTASSDFPTTVNAYDTTFNGGSYDIFVTKLGFPAALEKVYYSNINGNLSVDSGDKVYLQFDKRMQVAGATTSDFYLPVTNDKFGTGATVSINSVNDTQVVITLGTSPTLTILSTFNSNTTSAGSPSGIDISTTIVAGHIQSIDGLDATSSGVKDILYTLSSAVYVVTANVATTVQVSQDTINDYYTQHKLIIPKDALTKTTTIIAGLPGDNHGELSAVSFSPAGLTFSTNTPATLVIEYKDAEVRKELGYMETAMRIHQWDNPSSTWVILSESTSNMQSVDTANNTVSIKIAKFDAINSFMYSFYGPNTSIVFANIELPTVHATTAGVASSKGFLFASATTILSVGTTGIYTKHKLTLTDYTTSLSGSTIILCQPTLTERHGWSNYAVLKIITNGIITTSAKLTMEYKDSEDTVNHQYLSDVSGGNEYQMRMYHWNESLLQWEQLTTQWPSEVNPGNNTVTASLPANQLTGTQIYALKVDPLAVPVELSAFEAIIPKEK